LSGADLSEADLQEADLQEVNLRGTNLSGFNLSGADLQGANLRGANLSGANLSEADLRWTDLRWANLRGANLSGANLSGADLSEADLRGAIDVPKTVYDTTLITTEGDIIGYKKLVNGMVCKLLIPEGARRHNATGRKCRAEYAVVLEGEGRSRHDSSFVYKIGETVRPTTPFDNDRWDECGAGIHFFITRGEAEAY
jgi:hypothetical protein